MSSGPGEQAESLAFLMSNPAISNYISSTPAVSQLLNTVPGAAAAAAGFVAMNPYLYVAPVMSGGDPSGITSGPSGTFYITSTGPAIGNITVTGSNPIIPPDVEKPMFNTTGAKTTGYVEPVLTPLTTSIYTFSTISEAKEYLDSKVAVLNTPGLLQSGGYSVATKAIYDLLRSFTPEMLLKGDVELVNFYVLFMRLIIQINNSPVIKLEKEYLGNRFLDSDWEPSYGSSSEATYFRVIHLTSTKGYIIRILNAILNFCRPKLDHITAPQVSTFYIASKTPEPSPTFSEDVDTYFSNYIKELNGKIDEFKNQGEFLSVNSLINDVINSITTVINKIKLGLLSANKVGENPNIIAKKNLANLYRPSVLNAITVYVTKLNNLYTEIQKIKDTIASETKSRSNPATVVQSMQGSFSALTNPTSSQYGRAVNDIYNKTLTQVYNLLSIGSTDQAQILIRDVISKINTSNGATGATGAQSGGGPSLTDIIGSLSSLNNSIGTSSPSGPSGSSNALLGDIIPANEPLDTSRLELDSLSGPSGPSGSSGAVIVIPGFTVSGASTPSGAQVTGAQVTGAQVTGAQATGTQATGAIDIPNPIDLISTRATGADISGATGTDLSGASGADLSGTDLSGTDLSGATGPRAVGQPLFLSAQAFFTPLMNMFTKLMEKTGAEEPPPPPPEEPVEEEPVEEEPVENAENAGNSTVNNSNVGGGKRKRKTRRRLKARK